MRAHQSAVRGFSLIEVLVALLIVAVGLLGVAKMQSAAIGNTKVASSRSIASIFAASQAAAMMANKAYWAAGLLSAPGTVSVAGTALTETTLNSLTNACTVSACTPTELAAFDLKSWGTSLQAQLPSGTGAIACSTTVGVPITCSITVSWAEKYIGINGATSNTAQQTSNQSLALLVEP